MQAIEALEQFNPDILLLDIQMPGRTGLEVARHASGKAHVVFITAYDAFALQAFEQGALDYILQPISSDRMKLTVQRLQERMREPFPDLRNLTNMLKSIVKSEPQYLKRLSVPHASDSRGRRIRNPFAEGRQHIHDDYDPLIELSFVFVTQGNANEA